MLLRTENNLRAAVVILSLAVLLSLCTGADLWAREKPPAPKRVLALFLFQHGRMPWIYRLEESLRLALADNSSSPVELDIEHAAHSSFLEKRFYFQLVNHLRKKYAKLKVDLVLALGDISTELVLENGAMIFGDIPMVLVTSARKKLPDNRLRPNMAAFKWGVDFVKTGSLILDLLPQTKNLFVVSGISQFDQKIKEMAAADLGQLHGRRSRAEGESQRLRDELAHVSRVQAMGEIAASLAHEINQPLSAVRNYAQAGQRFLNNNPAEPGEVVKALAGVVVANRRAEEVITISVRDSGVGIDEEQNDVLFDAFYTTKPEGMGMGLSINRTIIEEHCGHLWATRNSGKGSTFSFAVPIYEEG